MFMALDFDKLQCLQTEDPLHVDTDRHFFSTCDFRVRKMLFNILCRCTEHDYIVNPASL